jgi:hypothetical protein
MTVVSRQLLLAVVVLCLAYTWTGEAQTTDVQRAAHVLSVREVRHASLAPSRYPTPPQYTIDMAFSYSGQTYCTGYETPVLDEVRDLQAANGHDIQVEMHGKKLMVVLPSGRRLKAELVKSSQC